MADLAWGAGTHPGQVRPDNEDFLHASDGIYVVADGMGGHEAGEIASALAVERIRDVLLAEDLAPTAERVVEAISDANGDIFRAAIANPGQAGMGTTVTAIAVIEDPMAGRGEPNLDVNDGIDPDKVTPVVPRDQPEALVLANVGDSRTYLYRHDRLRRVTVDHSYVQELVSTGHITDDEARTHPRRNIITRALGIEPDVKVDWWTLPLVRGDRFLLCSDGLVDEIPDPDIRKVLRENADPQTAVDLLIAMANAAGGRDNVTIIIVDVLDGDDPPDPTQELDLTPVWADDPAMSAEDLARIEAGDLELAGATDPTAEVATASGRTKKRRRRRKDAPADEGVTAADADTSNDDDSDGDTDGGAAAGAVAPAFGETSDSASPSTHDDTNDDTDKGADGDSVDASKKSKRPKLGRSIAGFVALALLISGFVIFAAWARSGYFVDFDDQGVVTVYKGQPDSVLWFEPTTENTVNAQRDELSDDDQLAVDRQPTFSSLTDAFAFARELVPSPPETSDDVPADDEPATDDTVATTDDTVDSDPVRSDSEPADSTPATTSSP